MSSKNNPNNRKKQKQSERTDVKQKYLSMSTWTPKYMRSAGKR